MTNEQNEKELLVLFQILLTEHKHFVIRMENARVEVFGARTCYRRCISVIWQKITGHPPTQAQMDIMEESQ